MDWSNRIEVMNEVRKDGAALQLANLKFRDDEEVVLAGMENDEIAFQLASDRLKDDKEFVTKIAKAYGQAIRFASNRLRNDRGVMEAAIKCDYVSYEYVSPELQKDRDLFMLSFKGSGGLSIAWGSEKFKDDEEIVMTAFIAARRQTYGNYESVLSHASNRLINDKQFISKIEEWGVTLEQDKIDNKSLMKKQHDSKGDTQKIKIKLEKMRDLNKKELEVSDQIRENIEGVYDHELEQVLEQTSDAYYEEYYKLVYSVVKSTNFDIGEISSKYQKGFMDPQFVDNLEFELIARDVKYVMVQTEEQAYAFTQDLQSMGFSVINDKYYENDLYGTIYCIDQDNNLILTKQAEEVLDNSENNVISMERFIESTRDASLESELCF